MRTNVKQPFLPSYACTADEAPYVTCVSKIIWTDSVTVAPDETDKVVLKIPININADVRNAALNNKPIPLALDQNAHKVHFRKLYF